MEGGKWKFLNNLPFSSTYNPNSISKSLPPTTNHVQDDRKSEYFHVGKKLSQLLLVPRHTQGDRGNLHGMPFCILYSHESPTSPLLLRLFCQSLPPGPPGPPGPTPPGETSSFDPSAPRPAILGQEPRRPRAPRFKGAESICGEKVFQWLFTVVE